MWKRHSCAWEKAHFILFPPARLHVIALSSQASLTGQPRQSCQMCLAEKGFRHFKRILCKPYIQVFPFLCYLIWTLLCWLIITLNVKAPLKIWQHSLWRQVVEELWTTLCPSALYTGCTWYMWHVTLCLWERFYIFPDACFHQVCHWYAMYIEPPWCESALNEDI